MASTMIDRGRGPEISGTRITVYNLLPYFLDPSVTEAAICELYDLTPEQVAAARAHAFQHADTVLAEHLKIEERLQADNLGEILETAERTRETFRQFRDWLMERGPAAASDTEGGPDSETDALRSNQLRSFRNWLAEREHRAGERIPDENGENP